MTQLTESRFSRERLWRLAEIERWHFWFAGRRDLVCRLAARYLGESNQLVLDIGCGNGIMVGSLTRLGYQVIGLDLLFEGLQSLRQSAPQSQLIQGEAARLGLKDDTLDAVLLLDVLEHVGDRCALREARRVLAPGGWVILTVPAMPWLWSYRDREAGHLRRYTRRGLRQILAEARFEIHELRYYQCLLFPALALSRLWGRHGARWRDREERPGRILNAIMKWIITVEVRIGDFIAWPWGSTLVAVCRKIPA